MTGQGEGPAAEATPRRPGQVDVRHPLLYDFARKRGGTGWDEQRGRLEFPSSSKTCC